MLIFYPPVLRGIKLKWTPLCWSYSWMGPQTWVSVSCASRRPEYWKEEYLWWTNPLIHQEQYGFYPGHGALNELHNLAGTLDGSWFAYLVRMSSSCTPLWQGVLGRSTWEVTTGQSWLRWLGKGDSEPLPWDCEWMHDALEERMRYRQME